MKVYCNQRSVGGDYFLIINGIRDGKHPLNYYLNKINIDDYIIYKSTNCFRELTPDELMEEKYSGYLFIRKDIYNEELFNKWLKWIKGRITLNYITKPFPNFDPFEKIKEIEL